MTIGSGLLVGRPHHQGHVIDHVYKDMWKTTSARTHGRPHQHGNVVDHVSRPHQQGHVVDHVRRSTSSDHVRKYMW
jgi:hypothetical protein